MAYTSSNYGAAGLPDLPPAPTDLGFDVAPYQQRQQNILNFLGGVRAKQQQAAQAAADAQAAEQRRQNTDWMTPAVQGASMGTAVSPGWGTLIGGAIGTILGLARATQTREKEGTNFGTALGKSIFDFTPITRGSWLTSSLPMLMGLGGKFFGAKAPIADAPLPGATTGIDDPRFATSSQLAGILGTPNVPTGYYNNPFTPQIASPYTSAIPSRIP